jgi:hypothetical protein
MKTFTSVWGLWRLICEVIGGRVIFQWAFKEFDALCNRKIAECNQRLEELE